MRQMREILRLTFSSGIPGREIARRLGIAASTVRETRKRFESAALTWPLADEALEARLHGAGTMSLILLAGAPGFEPGNGGIKIRL